MSSDITPPPPETGANNAIPPGAAGTAGMAASPGVGTASLPELKTPRNHRLSRQTLNALQFLQVRWGCTETMAVELAVARAAAYEIANMPDGVSTPPQGMTTK